MKLKPGQQIRRNRSFTLRQGRLTPGQQTAMEVLWPQYGFAFDERNPTAIPVATFANPNAPLTLEIGFGNGESLVEQAATQPERNFIGIEVHTPGVGHCLLGIQAQQLTNLRLIQADAIEVLKQGFSAASINKLQVFFPDPWHKKRHHKRRIIQPDFVTLASDRLVAGGRLHVATDWAEYAEYIHDVLSASTLQNLADAGEQCVPSPTDRPITKFERRGHRLNHDVFDFLYQKV